MYDSERSESQGMYHIYDISFHFNLLVIITKSGDEIKTTDDGIIQVGSLSTLRYFIH